MNENNSSSTSVRIFTINIKKLTYIINILFIKLTLLI